MARHNELGKLGEDAAVAFLQQAGHEIIARNYRYERAEIDIVSTHQNILIFTEVKLRSTNQFGYPEEFVSTHKAKLLVKAAEEFIHQHNWKGNLRFDVIAITVIQDKMNIYHIADAFFPYNG